MRGFPRQESEPYDFEGWDRDRFVRAGAFFTELVNRTDTASMRQAILNIYIPPSEDSITDNVQEQR